MKQITSFVLLTFVLTVAFVGCKKDSWCPVEATLPFVSVDIPDTVNYGQRFTCDFELLKVDCAKEYNVFISISHDTIRFSGAAMQDMCDCTDTVGVHLTRALELKTYDRYYVSYSVTDETGMLISNEYKQLIVNK